MDVTWIVVVRNRLIHYYTLYITHVWCVHREKTWLQQWLAVIVKCYCCYNNCALALLRTLFYSRLMQYFVFHLILITYLHIIYILNITYYYVLYILHLTYVWKVYIQCERFLTNSFFGLIRETKFGLKIEELLLRETY